MQISKLSLIVPALMIMSAGAFADQSAIPPQDYPPQQYAPPQQYPPQQYGYQDPCGGAPCAAPNQVLVPSPFDPNNNYYCQPGCPCPTPQVPYGPPPVVYQQPIYDQPVIVEPGPPYYGGGPIYGRPGYGGRILGGRGIVGGVIGRGGVVGGRVGPVGRPGGIIGGRPFRRMSDAGCVVEQDKHDMAQYNLKSSDNQVIFSSKNLSPRENEANAEYMKTYYTDVNPTGLCGKVGGSTAPLDI